MQHILDIAQVLQILRKELGFDSWIANSFIRKVTPNETIVPTLGITKYGELLYNPKFWKEHVNTPNKVVEVIFHELLHKAFGDFVREGSPVSNIAGDIVINYTVHTVLGHADMMTSYYPKKMWQGLLRPGAYIQARKTKFEKLYRSVWECRTSAHNSLYRQQQSPGTQQQSIGENSIAQVHFALKVLLNDEMLRTKYLLIGSHGNMEKEKEEQAGGGGEKGTGDSEEGTESYETELDAYEKGKIAGELIKLADSKCAGYSDELLSSVIGILRASCTLKQSLLRDFAIDSALNKIKSYYHEPATSKSVVPRYPSRRDVALLAAGCIPVLWTNEFLRQRHSNRGIAFYLDVSGSVQSELPRVLGVISSFRENVKRVFQFSNRVTESSILDLGRGKIDSTGGTDFDCVVEHAVDNNLRKIVIFTDGCASLTNENANKALKNIDKACVILISRSWNRDNWFSKHYMKTYKLDEIITAR